MNRISYFFLYIFCFQTIIFSDLFANRSGNSNPLNGLNSPWIRAIRICRLDVFNTDLPEYQKFPFPLINQLHINTRRKVIERELLFKTGESLDETLLEESERNLRSLQFIGKATITTIPTADDSVDIEVLVEDQWTTILGTKYDIQAGQPNYGIRLEEYNLLGWGQHVKGSLARIDQQNQREFYFSENRLLNTRLRIRYHYKGLEYGAYHRAFLGRPFYAERSRWSFETNYGIYRGERFIYNHENTLVSYQAKEIGFDGRLSHLIFHNHQQSARLSVLFYSNELKTANVHFPGEKIDFHAPHNYDRMLGIGLDWIRLRFLKEQFINRFGLIEDVSLGANAAIYVGKTVQPLSQQRWYLFGKLAHANKVARLIYLYGKFESYAYLNPDGWGETASLLQLKSYVNRFQPHTLAVNAEFSIAWRMPDYRQLFLGENRGLRGYPNYFKTGQKRIVVNLEDRIYPKIFIYSFGLGATIFTDLGYIWDNDEPLQWHRPYVATGIGLRIGSTKTRGAAVFRFDFAIIFRREPQLVISLGNNHFFSAFQNFAFVTPFTIKYGEYKE